MSPSSPNSEHLSTLLENTMKKTVTIAVNNITVVNIGHEVLTFNQGEK